MESEFESNLKFEIQNAILIEDNFEIYKKINFENLLSKVEKEYFDDDLFEEMGDEYVNCN